MLLKKLNSSGQVHMVPASFKGRYVIRFTVTSQYTREKDLERDWLIIQNMARGILNLTNIGITEEDEEEVNEKEEEHDKVPPQCTELPIREMKNMSMAGQVRKEGMKRKREFGLSLILSNVPMSPKFINGSFAALFDNHDVIMEYARQLNRRSMDLNGRPLRMSPRKRLKDQNKQYSFDLGVANRRPWIGIKYQGSLDSKIEEIFDSSFESDRHGEDSEDDEERAAAELSEFRRLYTADKAVQHEEEEEKEHYAIRPDTLETSSVHVNTASTPVDGATNTFHDCRHCGHPIDN